MTQNYIFEACEEWKINVFQAKEESRHTFPNPSVQTEVTIIITDVNDETPTFRSARYVGEINENAQSNTPVTFIGTAVPQVFDYDQVFWVIILLK